MWHDSLYILKYRRFFKYLEGAISILEDEETANDVDPQDVLALIDILYVLMMSSMKILLVAPDNPSDTYEQSPIVPMYLSLARCILHMKARTKSPASAVFRERLQCEVHFCTHNRLCLVSGVRICDFSVEELVASITIIERRANTLSYTKDMNSYIDSLEERACELMLYAQPEAILNVKSMHVHYKNDLYTCSTSTEFRLAVGILSLRKIANTALVRLRENAIIYDIFEDETAGQILEAEKLLQRVISHKCKSVHGDTINEQYADIYKQNAITISETCFFYKMNSIHARLDCSTIVQTHRNLAHWYTVTEAVKLDASHYIENPDEKLELFQIVFKIMVDVLFQQTITLPFNDFWVDGATIYDMSSDDFHYFQMSSRRTPFFVRSLCDACIYFNEQLYIFGQDSASYYRALAYWIILVNTRCGGMVLKTHNIGNLVDHICSDDFNEKKDQVKTPAIVVDKDYTMLPQQERERRRAFDLFNRVRLDIFGTKRALDSTNSVGDIESTGLPSSHRSAWFSSSSSSSSSSSHQ